VCHSFASLPTPAACRDLPLLHLTLTAEFGVRAGNSSKARGASANLIPDQAEGGLPGPVGIADGVPQIAVAAYSDHMQR
jgi:hypothetical protein